MMGMICYVVTVRANLELTKQHLTPVHKECLFMIIPGNLRPIGGVE